MAIRCDAVVERGLLRPMEDLGLRDSERVVLTIERIETREASAPCAEDLLIEHGLSHLSAHDGLVLAGCEVTDVDADEISRRLPLEIKGESLSATVIEERHRGW